MKSNFGAKSVFFAAPLPRTSFPEFLQKQMNGRGYRARGRHLLTFIVRQLRLQGRHPRHPSNQTRIFLRNE
jgi:hypothetical protein